MPRRFLALVLLVVLVFALVPLSLLLAQTTTATPTPTQSSETPTLTPSPLPALVYPLTISERPHDPDAFTQGLLLHDGLLYESTGQEGESTLREVDPETGEVLRIVHVDDQYFAEGLALVEDRLIQLTWTHEIAFVYDLETFEQIDTFEYEGQGWGLCYDGAVLWMSNGSDRLTQRDPQTFAVLDEIPVVMADGSMVFNLNELECVGDLIFANVWLTNRIVVIDKTSGLVVSEIDASFLRHTVDQVAFERGIRVDVLNGIAYDPENNTFLITGKDWPLLFEVQFVGAVGG